MTQIKDPRATILGRPVAGVARRRERALGITDERRWSRNHRAWLAASDTVIVIVSVGAAFFARFGVPAGSDLGELGQLYWLVSLAVVLTWSLMLAIFHTRDWRIIGVGVAEYRRVASASLFTFGSLAILFLVGKVDIARGFFVLTLPIGVVTLALSRRLWRRWVTRQRVNGRYLSRAIVGGSPADVAYVVSQIERNSGAAYHLIGAAVPSSGAPQPEIEGVPVVADLSNIALAAANLQVDTVILAGHPSGDDTFVRDLSWKLEGAATDLVLTARLTDVAGPRIHFRHVEGLPLIHVEIPQFDGGKHVLKRALDVTLSGIGLVVLWPLLLLLAVLVRLDSPGSAIYGQQRVGRNGRSFRMYKFRSMVASADRDRAVLLEHNDGAGVLFKCKNDPRVTRLGRGLRKYSLDELPQLWNVFRGDMSLIGPRPPLQSEVDAYEDHVQRRLFIKPGLTGMWQVSGRSDLSWEESVRLDLYYVENWSLTGDLIILWQTARMLLRPVGAY